jgi:hypothetical protein
MLPLPSGSGHAPLVVALVQVVGHEQPDDHHERDQGGQPGDDQDGPAHSDRPGG